jgi:hypothetical protein
VKVIRGDEPLTVVLAVKVICVVQKPTGDVIAVKEASVEAVVAQVVVAQPLTVSVAEAATAVVATPETPAVQVTTTAVPEEMVMPDMQIVPAEVTPVKTGVPVVMPVAVQVGEVEVTDPFTRVSNMEVVPVVWAPGVKPQIRVLVLEERLLM